MATQSTAQLYPSTGNMSGGVISTANPNLDGSGVVVGIFTASSNGSRVDQIHVNALGTTTDGMVRIFVRKFQQGSYLLCEIPVAAVTPSGTQKAWSADFFPSVPTFQGPSPLNLQAQDQLLASTNNGESFALSVFGINY